MVWCDTELIVAVGFAVPRPQPSSQSAGNAAFPRPPNPNTAAASGSAFSSVIGGREDRGLRKSFGNNSTAAGCVILIEDFESSCCF